MTVLTANDVDAEPPLVYSFEGGSGSFGPFTLDRYSGRLTLAGVLDAEKQKEYLLEIQASDEIHVVSTKLKIVIEDVNDNPPRFEQQFYQVSLPEDTPGGASIVQVSATDADRGDNGQFEYSLLPPIPPNPGFRIDPQTGAIFTIGALGDSAAGADPLLQLTVEAKDFGSPRLSSVTTIQVQIVSRTEKSQPRFQKQFYRYRLRERVLQAFIEERDRKPQLVSKLHRNL